MSITLLLRPAAEEDIRQAYRWYEEQRAGLGDDFLLCVEATLATIKENPQLFPAIHKQARRALVRRFPYAIFYVLRDEMISVLGVFHGSRNPQRWGERLP